MDVKAIADCLGFVNYSITTFNNSTSVVMVEGERTSYRSNDLAIHLPSVCSVFITSPEVLYPVVRSHILVIYDYPMQNAIGVTDDIDDILNMRDNQLLVYAKLVDHARPYVIVWDWPSHRQEHNVSHPTITNPLLIHKMIRVSSVESVELEDDKIVRVIDVDGYTYEPTYKGDVPSYTDLPDGKYFLIL